MTQALLLRDEARSAPLVHPPDVARDDAGRSERSTRPVGELAGGEVMVDLRPSIASPDLDLDLDLEPISASISGIVVAVGPRVSRFIPGDEVMGWSPLSTVAAPRRVAHGSRLIHKLPHLGWTAARSLPSVGTTAWAAVNALDPQVGETVVVFSADSAHGRLAVQLLTRRGIRTIAVCAPESQAWMNRHGALAVPSGNLLRDRVRAAGGANGVDGYVDLSHTPDLVIPFGLAIDHHRIVVDPRVADPRFSELAHIDRRAASTLEIISELSYLVAGGELEFESAL